MPETDEKREGGHEKRFYVPKTGGKSGHVELLNSGGANELELKKDRTFNSHLTMMVGS